MSEDADISAGMRMMTRITITDAKTALLIANSLEAIPTGQLIQSETRRRYIGFLQELQDDHGTLHSSVLMMSLPTQHN